MRKLFFLAFYRGGKKTLNTLENDDDSLRYYVSRQKDSLHYWIMKEEYFLSDRFFSDAKFQKLCGGAFQEIVSMDTLLFSDRKYLLREDAASIVIPEGKQVIAVHLIELDEVPSFSIQGFEFCGYDLAEAMSEISSLVNCGDFSATFIQSGLNKYGLVSSYSEALELRERLYLTYPDEPHADCAIYAIWRRVGK